MMTMKLTTFIGNSRKSLTKHQKKDILVVQGDWNAKVGRDTQADRGDVCGPYTIKNICRFYGKITGNQLPVHFPLLFTGARKHFQESGTER